MPKPFVHNDAWSQKAAKEGYRARSVYKLMEIDERFDLLQPGMHVLDIGAAPGSWLQYASKRVGHSGMVLGIDLKEIKNVGNNVKTRVCDLTDHAAMREALSSLGWTQADVILSDIAPNTSGIKDVDQWRSVELSRLVLETALQLLSPNGTLVMKVFRGKNFDEFTAEVKKHFPAIKVMSVRASRDRSREVYVLGFKKRRK